MTINPRNGAMKTVILAAAAAALALTAGCGKEAPEVRPAGRDVSCTTAKAATTDLPVVITAVAGVEPAEHVQISTRMMGWVSELHVREGDAVRKGQALLKIDDADLRAKRAQVEAGIRAAEAVVANAEANAARFANLYASKAVSKQQLDEVRHRARPARAPAWTAPARAAPSWTRTWTISISAPPSTAWSPAAWSRRATWPIPASRCSTSTDRTA